MFGQTLRGILAGHSSCKVREQLIEISPLCNTNACAFAAAAHSPIRFLCNFTCFPVKESQQCCRAAMHQIHNAYLSLCWQQPAHPVKVIVRMVRLGSLLHDKHASVKLPLLLIAASVTVTGTTPKVGFAQTTAIVCSLIPVTMSIYPQLFPVSSSTVVPGLDCVMLCGVLQSSQASGGTDPRLLWFWMHLGLCTCRS